MPARPSCPLPAPRRLAQVPAAPTARRASPSDAELLRTAASEPAAFETVFLRHVAAIQRYIGGRVAADTVEDLVSETFTVAYDRRGCYRHEYPDARPWLFGIATNIMRRHHRTERTRFHAYRRIPLGQAEDGPESTAAALVDARSARTVLLAALTQVQRGDRDALLLMAWAELSYEEISRALEIPLGTVRSRINRARRCLRELLADAPPILERDPLPIRTSAQPAPQAPAA